MHYGIDPKIKCLSVIMCLKVKNRQRTLRCIAFLSTIYKIYLLYVADAHSTLVIHCCFHGQGLKFVISRIIPTGSAS
jgi:hypothetical protein